MTRAFVWTGKVAWSGKVSEDVRKRTLAVPKVPESSGPSEWWLTEFEDYWPYQVAKGDVYFSKSAETSEARRPPMIQYYRRCGRRVGRRAGHPHIAHRLVHRGRHRGGSRRRPDRASSHGVSNVVSSRGASFSPAGTDAERRRRPAGLEDSPRTSHMFRSPANSTSRSPAASSARACRSSSAH